MFIYIHTFKLRLTHIHMLTDLPLSKKENSRCEPVGGRGCHCNENTWKYEYVTQCELHTWDKEKLCRVLQDRNLLFVGDSVVQQSFSAFKSKVLVGNIMKECEDSVKFEHSDTLINKQFHAMNRGTHINDILIASKSMAKNQNKSVTIFVSAGGHIDSLDNAVNVMNQTMNMCITEAVDCVWLPQLPNHNNCTNIVRPFHSYSEVMNNSYTSHHIEDDINHHDYYEQFFQTALNMFEPKLVDTWHALALRGDAHTRTDCLHWCILNLDVVANIIYHHLESTYLM